MVNTLVFSLQDVTKGLLTAIKTGDADIVRGLLDSGYLDEHVLETKLVSFILFPDRGFLVFERPIGLCTTGWGECLTLAQGQNAIASFQCHAIQNKNQNHSIDKVQILRKERR